MPGDWAPQVQLVGRVWKRLTEVELSDGARAHEQELRHVETDHAAPKAVEYRRFQRVRVRPGRPGPRARRAPPAPPCRDRPYRYLADLLAQLLQHPIRIGVRFASNVGGLTQRAVLDVRGARLGRAHQLVLVDAFGRLRVGIAQDAISLRVRVCEHLVALLGQPPGGLDLFGDRHPDLVEDVENLLLVDERARRQGHARARAKHLLELVEQIQDVQRLNDNRGYVSPEAYRLMRVRPWRRVDCKRQLRRPLAGGSVCPGLLEDHDAGRLQHAGGRRAPRQVDSSAALIGVGRIGEDQVDRPVDGAQPDGNGRLVDARPIVEASGSQVRREDARRVAILLDELGATARRDSAPRCPARRSPRTGRARAARRAPRRSRPPPRRARSRACRPALRASRRSRP